MALSDFQRDVCRLLADNRVRSGESYVAGGAALNELPRSPRRSRDMGSEERLSALVAIRRDVELVEAGRDEGAGEP